MDKTPLRLSKMAFWDAKALGVEGLCFGQSLNPTQRDLALSPGLD